MATIPVYLFPLNTWGIPRGIDNIGCVDGSGLPARTEFLFTTNVLIPWGILYAMGGYFWNTVLAVNSGLWFLAIGFLTYSTGMLIIAGEWKQFLIALSVFAGLSFTEQVLTGLAHD